MFDPPNFPPLYVCDNGKCLSRALFLASVAQTPPLANATSFTTRRAPPDFAPIFNVVGTNSGIVHAGLLQKREVRRGVADGLGPSVAAGRTITRRPTSRRGHRQYLPLGPWGARRRGRHSWSDQQTICQPSHAADQDHSSRR